MANCQSSSNNGLKRDELVCLCHISRRTGQLQDEGTAPGLEGFLISSQPTCRFHSPFICTTWLGWFQGNCSCFTQGWQESCSKSKSLSLILYSLNFLFLKLKTCHGLRSFKDKTILELLQHKQDRRRNTASDSTAGLQGQSIQKHFYS